MKTPITYYGGKQAVAKKIASLIPPHKLYCEPFVGGGAVFWERETPSKIEVLNDFDDRLINFYRIAQTDSDSLNELIQSTMYSESNYRSAGEILKSGGFSNLYKAWAYFIQTQQSFASRFGSGWGRTKTDNSVAVAWNNKKQRFYRAIKRLEHVQVSCCDAIKCIKHYDSSESFFYIDPPYINTDQRYKFKYTLENYLELIELLKQIKGKFILSNYEQKNVEMPKNWHHIILNSRRQLRGKPSDDFKQTKEYLWANFDLEKVTE